jgi:hypothetical protein
VESAQRDQPGDAIEDGQEREGMKTGHGEVAHTGNGGRPFRGVRVVLEKGAKNTVRKPHHGPFHENQLGKLPTPKHECPRLGDLKKKYFRIKQ